MTIVNVVLALFKGNHLFKEGNRFKYFGRLFERWNW